MISNTPPAAPAAPAAAPLAPDAGVPAPEEKKTPTVSIFAAVNMEVPVFIPKVKPLAVGNKDEKIETGSPDQKKEQVPVDENQKTVIETISQDPAPPEKKKKEKVPRPLDLSDFKMVTFTPEFHASSEERKREEKIKLFSTPSTSRRAVNNEKDNLNTTLTQKGKIQVEQGLTEVQLIKCAEDLSLGNKCSVYSFSRDQMDVMPKNARLNFQIELYKPGRSVIDQVKVFCEENKDAALEDIFLFRYRTSATSSDFAWCLIEGNKLEDAGVGYSVVGQSGDTWKPRGAFENDILLFSAKNHHLLLQTRKIHAFSGRTGKTHYLTLDRAKALVVEKVLKLDENENEKINRDKAIRRVCESEKCTEEDLLSTRVKSAKTFFVSSCLPKMCIPAEKEKIIFVKKADLLFSGINVKYKSDHSVQCKLVKTYETLEKMILLGFGDYMGELKDTKAFFINPFLGGCVRSAPRIKACLDLADEFEKSMIFLAHMLKQLTAVKSELGISSYVQQQLDASLEMLTAILAQINKIQKVHRKSLIELIMAYELKRNLMEAFTYLENKEAIDGIDGLIASLKKPLIFEQDDKMMLSKGVSAMSKSQVEKWHQMSLNLELTRSRLMNVEKVLNI